MDSNALKHNVLWTQMPSNIMFYDGKIGEYMHVHEKKISKHKQLLVQL